MPDTILHITKALLMVGGMVAVLTGGQPSFAQQSWSCRPNGFGGQDCHIPDDPGYAARSRPNPSYPNLPGRQDFDIPLPSGRTAHCRANPWGGQDCSSY